ncbi:MAG: FRG domain-containing protein [Pseudomonadota bacterium]
MIIKQNMPSSTIHEITVHSLEALRNEFDGCENGKYIFRGQSNASWPLETSIFRFRQRLTTIRYGKNALLGKEKLDWRKLMRSLEFDLFKRYNHDLSPGEELKIESDLLKVLTTLQHYGCPTRLLDFTWTPYTALFFAASEHEGDFAVYAISTKDIEEVTCCSSALVKDFWGEEGAESPMVHLFRPKYTNKRMKLQQGVFLIPSTTVIPLEEIIATSSLPVRKMIIPGKLRADIITMLASQLNMGPERVYPETEGEIKSLAWEISAKLFT